MSDFLDPRPPIHGQAYARDLIRTSDRSKQIGSHTFNLPEQVYNTKDARDSAVSEARMSIKHKLVNLPGYEMYNKFISNLTDAQKPYFEHLEPMTNQEYLSTLKASKVRTPDTPDTLPMKAMKTKGEYTTDPYNTPVRIADIETQKTRKALFNLEQQRRVQQRPNSTDTHSGYFL